MSPPYSLPGSAVLHITLLLSTAASVCRGLQGHQLLLCVHRFIPLLSCSNSYLSEKMLPASSSFFLKISLFTLSVDFDLNFRFFLNLGDTLSSFLSSSCHYIQCLDSDYLRDSFSDDCYSTILVCLPKNFLKMVKKQNLSKQR